MKKIRAFGHPWHWGHDWELLKLPFIEWTWLEQHYRMWREHHYWLRGVTEPPVKIVPYYEPGKYDVAILHIDQQIVQPGVAKNNLYRELNEVITDIPKVVLNHGTPMLDIEGLDFNTVINGGTIKWKGAFTKIKGVKDEVGDNFHLVNSEKALEEWGWGDVIIHGLDENEWWDLPKEPRVFISQSEAGMSDRYYGRRFLEAVRTELRLTHGINLVHCPVNWIAERDEKHINYFDAYREALGRSLIYFNPTGDSPMPRSRTEAMFSGCCMVTTKNHGIENIIEDGVSGFFVEQDPFKTSALINDLIHNRFNEAVEIGKRGREAAIKKLGIKRFQADWETYLRDKVLK